MRRSLLFGSLAAVAAGAGILGRTALSPTREPVFESASQPPALAPLCPWRNPEADLPILFPGATRYAVEDRVLSGLRPELARRLGRLPTGDENVLQVYRVYRAEEPVGELVTRRVKGTFGAIELVIAADNVRRLKGILIQRMRESQAVGDALLAVDWPRWWRLSGPVTSSLPEGLMSSLPPDARASAAAILEGTHASLILLSVSDAAVASPATAHSQHL